MSGMQRQHLNGNIISLHLLTDRCESQDHPILKSHTPQIEYKYPTIPASDSRQPTSIHQHE
ncbi:hypothetical protein PGTUg99_031947 [Puccinia graminis f. sp. tritici]|uniref:Uncharacterized protein n=1 Tax=Puccinia graminis f. sp. tritici TaxID=56615 RepID=A0A5B0RRG4_PUCGR|nr:hypothetical protein PGTUg99_031947 [Puccinia graminis f. sp. tritici]